MARPPGSSIGRYQIQDFIARGETTVVYQALEPESGAMVALKILPPSSARDPEQANRFLRQADALARLDHANLLSILDYGREEQVPFVAVSLAEGGALEARMASYREEAAALSLVASLASAIDYAHQNDVIHARIGPAHVLFDAQDAPLLTGLGRPYSAATGGRPPAFLAPEQVQDLSPDRRTDTYQLGALLFELLLGHPPEPEPEFKPEPGFGPEPGLGTDPDLGPEAELGPDIERGPHSGRAGLPDDIQAILVKALASAPEERFQSAGDLLHVLNDSLERRSAAAPRTESPPVVPPPAEAPPEEPAAEEPAAGNPVPEEPAPDETQGQARTKVSVAAVPAPAESAPQHAEHPPGRDKNKIWLTAAVIGLAMLLTLCCLLAVFALFEINDRLREPVATAQVDTNVRSGPALEYEIIGLLREGEQATVYGVSLDGRWWQIAFDAGRGGVGWVPAAFVTVDETGNIDVIPPPTLTPFPAVFASATMIGILAMVIPFRSH